MTTANDGAKNQFKTIVFKSVHGDLYKEGTFSSIAALNDLWVFIAGQEDKENADLVFRGDLLIDPWLTVGEVFETYDKPVVFVVLKNKTHQGATKSKPMTSLRSAIAPTLQEAVINQTTNRAETMQNDQVRCRICYSNENTPSDPLFRPCLCRGTVGAVHVSCLNAWRERPENPDAYFRCANCGYEYRIARTRFAQLLTSEEYARIGTLSFMLLVVLSVSLFSWLVLPATITDRFYDMVEWMPPDDYYPAVRHLVFGISCVGLAGFLVHLKEMWEYIRDHGTMETMFAFGLGLTANGKRGVRVFAFCGLAVAYRLMFVECDRLVRRLFTAFGERVLAVGE